MPAINAQAVARVVCSTDGAWTRLDIAQALNRAKTTHVIAMIEQAVKEGLISKHAGYDRDWRPCFVYCNPDVIQLDLGEGVSIDVALSRLAAAVS
jgi:predicted transcriptional regulator